MIDIYVLNKSLELIGIIDSYKSLIWANRYNDLGDCEIYCAASDENINLLQMGFYLTRLDDEMICRINKIELDTSAEDGNFLIATGADVKGFLDQRIIWNTTTNNGVTETLIRNLVTQSVITPTDTARKMKKPNGNNLIELGTSQGFKEASTEQISYKNVGEKIRELCKSRGWGYRMTLKADGSKFVFNLYNGTDRSNEVVFSDQFENLSSTTYINSRENMGNVALIGGAGEGAARIKATLGTAESIDRYESFIDQKSLSPVIKYSELTSTFNGSVVSSGSAYVYQVTTLLVPIIDDAHEDWLEANYSGMVRTVSGVKFYQIHNAIVADLDTSSPTSDTDVTLRELIYHSNLLLAGQAALAGYGETETFDGSVIPDVTFKYKTDYFLGDIVHVENEFGISADARIVEVLECVDDNGYTIEPQFEYLS